VNNIFVSCFNHNYQAHDYLNSIDIDDVLEIHLAGYTEKILDPSCKIIKSYAANSV
jgi:uncharacterized protein (UPF0276 family)